MSRMKRYAEQVSVGMGRGGAIDDEVMAEAALRLQSAKAKIIDPDDPATLDATAAAIIESGDLERGGR